ncbi:MAG: penicillin acylase family protein [Sedimentisphaerales bacterium]
MSENEKEKSPIMWPKIPIASTMRRIFGSSLWIVGLALFASGCSTWSYLTYRISPDYPKDKTDTLELHGLQAPVRVHFDDLGVPHIEAENELDLVRAAGFLHGRARFFQMDTVRRYARGRLSELFGEQQAMFGSTVTLDATMRSWGLEEAAESEAAGLDEESRALLAVYAEGVNSALGRFEPVEYRLLRVRPEPWTIADSFAVGSMVGWGITHNWQQEMCRLLLALQVGHERAEQILPPEVWPGAASLQAEGAPRALPPSVVPEVEAMFGARPYAGARAQVTAEPTRGVVPKFEGGSNGWAVGGERTRSGMPILAGDPHLPHIVPSIVFQQHLHCPGLEVIGMTLPGIPYVMFGHNQQVAWTITAAMADVVDLYIEREDPENGGQVLGPGGPEPMVSETVIVRIREGSAFREKPVRIRRTPRGPLLNDMYPDLLGEGVPLVSVHWRASGAGRTLMGLRRANGAANVHELRAAMMDVVIPISAVSAADTNGDIALFATGSVPVRAHHRGTFPVPAWVAKYQWTAWARPEDVPHVTASGRAFLANANNLMIDPARTEVLFQVDSAPSYRRDRIVEMIKATDKHTFESIAQIQGDVLLLQAKHILPAMLEDLRGLQNKTPIQEQAMKLLSEWDYRAEADSAACAIFFSTYREAIVGAIRDEVDEKNLKFLLSFRYFTNGIDMWFGDPEHPIWDDRSTGEQETRADVVRPAFSRGVAWLRHELGRDDPASWRWGELHRLEPAHTLGSKVGSFNLRGWEAPGAGGSVWAAGFDMGQGDRPFRSLYGPVLRMIVDLADINHARWIIDTGSSGWPHSPHYGDQHELWRRVEFAPMISDWDQIRKNAVGVLTLRQAKR